MTDKDEPIRATQSELLSVVDEMSPSELQILGETLLQMEADGLIHRAHRDKSEQS